MPDEKSEEECEDFGEQMCGLFAQGLSDAEIAKIILDDCDGAELLVARIRILEREIVTIYQDMAGPSI